MQRGHRRTGLRWTERAELESDRLARENQRRKAKGLTTFASLEEMEKATADENSSLDGSGKTPDVLLERTTQIVGDLVAGLPEAAPGAMARQQPAAGTARPATQ